MKTLWSDPVVLVAGGVLLLGLVLFVWGIKRLFRRHPASGDASSPISLELDSSSETPLPQDMPFTASKTVLPLAEQVNKEMAQKLETMTQRLADMQAIVNKQTAAAHAPAIPPETLDKMLQSVNGVIQQVDVLQKAFESAPVVAAPVNPATPATPPAASVTATSPAPAAAPATAPAQAPAAPAQAQPNPTIIPVSEIVFRNPSPKKPS